MGKQEKIEHAISKVLEAGWSLGLQGASRETLYNERNNSSTPKKAIEEIALIEKEFEKEPVYVNSFDKPVYLVNNAHIKKVANGRTIYELQLNDQYFQIDEDMLRNLAEITYLEGNVGLSIG